MLVNWAEVASYVTGTGVVATALGLLRWGIRVDRGLANTVKSTELLAERLNGHEKLDGERHRSLEDAIERIDKCFLATTPFKK